MWPGEDTNPTEIKDPFPCTWEDPFCIVYLPAGIVLQAYDIPSVVFFPKTIFGTRTIFVIPDAKISIRSGARILV